MSVYKRRGSDTYSYDFHHRGHRFSGQTGCTRRRDAEEYLRQLKAKLRESTIDTARPLTLGEAATLYWTEVGQHHRNSDDTERTLAWLQTNVGARTPIADIDDALVARLVARRRGETVARRRDGELTDVLISPATVNRTVTQPLEAILRRASAVWGQRVKTIDWRRHKLKEPRERVREATREEESEISAALREDYLPAVVFAILTGCRRAEIIGLSWSRVDFFNHTLIVTGKGDRIRAIPMTAAVFDLLWTLKDHHPEAVFTYEARRAKKASQTGGTRIRGHRYPLTAEGFKTAWRRAIDKTGVTDFRFHDTRHTAASRLVRASGNIKLAQIMLGHSDIATTTKYAHVTQNDLRHAMEAASTPATGTPTQSTTQAAQAARK